MPGSSIGACAHLGEAACTTDPPGSPASISVALPSNAAFLGLAFFVQDGLFDVTPGALTRIGLTEAFELTLGP